MKENSIKKDIKIVENLLQTAHVDNEEYYKQIEIGDITFNAIKNIVSDYKRVLKENEELKNQEATQRKINELLVQRYSNSIPIQKVKNKIEDLKMSGGSDGKDNTENTSRELAIEALQDILEESEVE